MKKEEFRELVIRAKTDNDVAEVVIEYLINKYGVNLTKVYFLSQIGDEQDILQYARIGAWLGIKYYNPEYKKINVEIYILNNMRNKIIDAVKKNTRKCRHHDNCIYFYPKDENSEYDDLSDFFSDEVNIEQNFIKKEFRQTLNNIPFSKVEKIVMEYKINRDIPSKDISKITGLGLKTIDNAYERIKKKVKNSEEIKEYLARQ